MHTAFELKRSMITLDKDGVRVSREEVLDWELRDRLGVVVRSPLGALGAGLLVLLCTTAFYDADKRRRRQPLYAPVYLFHIGRGWGFNGEFDFWPARKEIIVADPAQTLSVINSHGITHLAVPEREQRTVAHRYKEPEDFLDRMKQAYLYSPTGVVEDPSIVLKSGDVNVMQNFERTANGRETLTLRQQEVADDPQWQADTPAGIDARLYVNLMRERLSEIDSSDPGVVLVQERVRRALREGAISEALAPITPEDVLSLLD